MKPVYEQITLNGALGAKTVNALVDPTAAWSCIRSEVASHISSFHAVAAPIKVRIGERNMESRDMLICDVTLKGLSMYGAFVVLPYLEERLIIGTDFLDSWKIKIDTDSGELIVDPSSLQLQLI